MERIFVARSVAPVSSVERVENDRSGRTKNIAGQGLDEAIHRPVREAHDETHQDDIYRYGVQEFVSLRQAFMFDW